MIEGFISKQEVMDMLLDLRNVITHQRHQEFYFDHAEKCADEMQDEIDLKLKELA